MSNSTIKTALVRAVTVPKCTQLYETVLNCSQMYKLHPRYVTVSLTCIPVVGTHFCCEPNSDAKIPQLSGSMFPGLFSVRRNFLLGVADRTDRHPHLGVMQKADFGEDNLFNGRCFWKVNILISLFMLSILMKYSTGFQAISSDSLFERKGFRIATSFRKIITKLPAKFKFNGIKRNA